MDSRTDALEDPGLPARAATEATEATGATESESAARPTGPFQLGWRLALLVLVASVIGLLYWQFGDWLSLDRLAQHEQQMLEFRDRYWWWVLLVAFVIYVAASASLPSAAVLSLVYAWFFKFWTALVLISFASTMGATLAFLFSRFLFRDFVQRRFQDRWQSFDRKLEQEGGFYLFTLRLIPSVPFFVINLAMGPTRIHWWTFWWVSQVGMLPGTIVYVSVGAAAPNLQTLAEQGLSGIVTWPLILAFVLLSLLPWAAKWLVARLGKTRGAS